MNVSMPVIWLIIFAVFVIIELATMGLTTIWFAGGSLIAFVCALVKLPIWVQVIAFLIVSGLLLYFTRPIAVKYFNKTRTKTNVESMIGKQAVVVSEIDNLQGTGQVKVIGMDWSARSFIGFPIKEGNVVIVKAVEGVKLIVETEEESK